MLEKRVWLIFKCVGNLFFRFFSRKNLSYGFFHNYAKLARLPVLSCANKHARLLDNIHVDHLNRKLRAEQQIQFQSD